MPIGGPSTPLALKKENEMAKMATSSRLKKAKNKVDGARFRFLNEKLYNSTSEEAFNFFKSNPDQFKMYHQGFRRQLSEWTEKPIDLFVKDLKLLKGPLKVVDIGCGEALLAHRVNERDNLHSFVNIDLFAVDNSVTVANMTSLPFDEASFDIAIFCLSLMNVDYEKALYEASRVLKPRGEIWIAEVKSRLENVKEFLFLLQKIGFSITCSRKASGDMFFIIKGLKARETKKFEKIQHNKLKPCVYKKR